MSLAGLQVDQFLQPQAEQSVLGLCVPGYVKPPAGVFRIHSHFSSIYLDLHCSFIKLPPSSPLLLQPFLTSFSFLLLSKMFQDLIFTLENREVEEKRYFFNLCRQIP